jgi:hypothetical protein
VLIFSGECAPGGLIATDQLIAAPADASEAGLESSAGMICQP